LVLAHLIELENALLCEKSAFERKNKNKVGHDDRRPICCSVAVHDIVHSLQAVDWCECEIFNFYAFYGIATACCQIYLHSAIKSVPACRLQYSVRIINNKKKSDFTVQVPAGQIILDAAETQGVSIPYSCRAGSCSSCVGKLRSGTVDQSSQIFLNSKQVA
jgi:ferredoxin